MKIASWNINSVRIRLPIVKKFLEQSKVDILCLQETKTEDQFFPRDFFTELGYNQIAIYGQKSYNGVAIIAKDSVKIISSRKIDILENDARLIEVKISGNNHNEVILHNIYIPAGGDEPDTEINPKFKYKLDYINGLQNFYRQNYNNETKIISVGDFNIAPYEHDVWNHKQLLKIVSHTPIEVETLGKLRKTLNMQDISRHFVDKSVKLYTWWSYRNRDWQKSNRGRRLDHVWCSENLLSDCQNFNILQDFRNEEKPSDHVPVIAEFSL